MLRYNRSSGVHPPFFAVFAVASRLGAAHQRNRIKRRLREALHAVLRAGHIRQAGFEIAIIPKKETADLDFGKLCDDLQAALRKLPKQKQPPGASQP